MIRSGANPHRHPPAIEWLEARDAKASAWSGLCRHGQSVGLQAERMGRISDFNFQMGSAQKFLGPQENVLRDVPLDSAGTHRRRALLARGDVPIVTPTPFRVAQCFIRGIERLGSGDRLGRPAI
jgi:hypothetical protein